MFAATVAAAEGLKDPSAKGTHELFLLLSSADNKGPDIKNAAARLTISYKSTPVREGLPLENPGHTLYRPVSSIITSTPSRTGQCVVSDVRSGRAPPVAA